MAIHEIRDEITYAHVREEDPKSWVDLGLSARTPAPSVKKALLLVRRIDGQFQKWFFTQGAYYVIAEVGLLIRGPLETPIPPV
jgi:hypothetical protein